LLKQVTWPVAKLYIGRKVNMADWVSLALASNLATLYVGSWSTIAGWVNFALASHLATLYIGR
jgi:hypothetical protein